MSIYSDEVLWQLFLTGPVWDGDLVSKTGRDELVDSGHVARAKGWQTLTKEGMVLAIERGFGRRKDSYGQIRRSKALMQGG